MSPWGWTPERTLGIWRYGAIWLRPLAAAIPWLTLLVLLLMLNIVSNTMTAAKGTLFDLPVTGLAEGEATGLVALAIPHAHETLVFFDDSRYVLDDVSSSRALAEHLAERVARSESKTLLVLADRRVHGGDLMDLAAVAKRGGATKVLFAQKRVEASDE
ncbi:MAG: hypothetical protein IJQ65_03880 [Kiritimatiellae bacterium]|nr:hypothetical protein [Kiritimatiellia bacterium]